MGSKYGNEKVRWNGILFDSKHELERWIVLKDMEKRGEITWLRRQVRYKVIPEMEYNGKKLKPNYYVVDFEYDKDGETILEDAKGVETEVYRLKKKLVYQIYGRWVHEV